MRSEALSSRPLLDAHAEAADVFIEDAVDARTIDFDVVGTVIGLAEEQSLIRLGVDHQQRHALLAVAAGDDDVVTWLDHDAELLGAHRQW